jgi:hypothetical protein
MAAVGFAFRQHLKLGTISIFLLLFTHSSCHEPPDKKAAAPVRRKAKNA